MTHPRTDDNAPAERKTLWLATFYLCMPVGYAVGYIFGGVVGVGLGWRAAFLLEALAMIPLVLFCLLVPPIDLKGTHESALYLYTLDFIQSTLGSRNNEGLQVFVSI